MRLFPGSLQTIKRIVRDSEMKRAIAQREVLEWKARWWDNGPAGIPEVVNMANNEHGELDVIEEDK